MTSLQELRLNDNLLTALPEGVFDGLTGLQELLLYDNLLTALPEGVFDGLTSLQELRLFRNLLTALPEGVFDGLTSLQELHLGSNLLTALPEGAFDDLGGLQELSLGYNQLTALPEGVFAGLTSLQELQLQNNHLVGLSRNDPLFATLPSGFFVDLGGQTEAPAGEQTTRLATRLGAAVPFMPSASDAMRQGFVRITDNWRYEQSGGVRILAFDDRGNASQPIAVQLGRRR